MPFRIGVLAYPAFIVMLQLGKPNAVSAFEQARAYDPQTSRRPESLAVPRKALAKAVRRKMLVATGDGRYYVDRRAVRRSDRRTLMWMLAGGLAFIPVVWLLW